jgi:hypothetical protein
LCVPEAMTGGRNWPLADHVQKRLRFMDGDFCGNGGFRAAINNARALHGPHCVPQLDLNNTSTTPAPPPPGSEQS